MLIAFHTSYRIARRVTDQLWIIQKKTEEINAGDFGTLLATSDIKELTDLAESINSMSRRLQMQFTDLNIEKEKFDSLLQNLREGVFAIDLEKKILFQNKSIPKNLIPPYSQFRKLDDVSSQKKFLSFVDDLMSSGQEDGKLNVEINKKYYKIWFYSLKSNNQPVMYIGVISDKTEEREIQLFREQFVQNASHELKTPITSIKGYAETLDTQLRQKADSKEKKFIDAILRNSDRMIRIVEDMLTVSRLESQNSVFQPEKIVLSELIESLSLTVEGFISLKNQKFTVKAPKDLKINADLVLMEHLLLNLLQNASIYSEEGKKIQLIVEETSNGHIQIKVIDEGIGISEEHQKRIFERFYRVDLDRSRKSGGTGLGLSIVKHIAKLHGGYVSVNSVPGEGSTFIVNLPIDRKNLTL